MDLLLRLGAYDGGGCELRELDQDGFVRLVELALVLVRELDQAKIAAVVTDKRRREPTPQGGMLLRMLAEPPPAGVRFEIGLGHPHRPVALADPAVDARPVRQAGVVLPADILVRQRHGRNSLRPVGASGDAAHRLVGPDDVTRGIRDGLEGRLEAWRPQDRAGRLRQGLELLHATELIAGGVKLLCPIPQDLQESFSRAGRALERHHQPTGPEAGAVLPEVPALVLGAAIRLRALHLLLGRIRDTVLGREDHADVLA
jgi:hypothetical protein